MQNQAPGEFAATVAAEIRAEMARKRLEVAALAEHMDVSTRTVSRLLNGKRTIDLTELEAVAEFLGIDHLEIIRRATSPGRAA